LLISARESFRCAGPVHDGPLQIKEQGVIDVEI
jgi:hypothetical protein